MTNVFKDVEKFHIACEQNPHPLTFSLYLNLMSEEFEELQVAMHNRDRVEQLDALIDILVVTIGAIRAADFDGEGAWNEVMGTNFAKIDPETGKVRKREDGKVLKPEGWEPPQLEPFTNQQKIPRKIPSIDN